MNKSILLTILTTICLFTAGVIIKMSPSTSSIKRHLKVGYPYKWGSLIPSLQHTVYADAIISNSYEPLVERGSNGLLVPAAAKSWHVNENYTVFTFKVDTTKQFSNGEYLKAFHFKDAWEHGLKLAEKSHNKSLLDGLYNLEGFSDFEKTGKLIGVKVIDDETLQLTYSSPFRQALDQLSGYRFSVFIIRDGKYLGTGRYVISDSKEKEAFLTVNKYHKDSKDLCPIELMTISPENAIQAVKNNKIDVYEFAISANFEECLSLDNFIKCRIGQEASHLALAVNGNEGKVLSNPNYRLALQAIILENIDIRNMPKKYQTNGLKMNHQMYLPLQPGAIREDEVNRIIQKGRKYVKELSTATQQRPLFIVAGKENEWLYSALKNNNIKITNNSGEMKWSEAINNAYKKGDMDLFLLTFSIMSGDPDGLYHALGNNGAILLPMVHRPQIADLLEKGRKILKREDLDSHYQNITRAVLEEVPYIHIGFTNTMSGYRNDHVKVIDDSLKQREDFKLHIYRLIE